MAIPAWKMMPALVCGNTLVIKPAEDTPLSTYNLIEILSEAGLPPGVVNLVGGDGPGAGAPLTKHADVPVVSLRVRPRPGGSLRRPARPASSNYSLEMGGKNIIW